MSVSEKSPLTEAGAVAGIVAEAALAASGPRPVQTVHPAGLPFTVLLNKDGSQTLCALEQFLPPRKGASAAFVEAQSFIDYVKTYKDAHSRFFFDVEQRAFSAILDYHDPAAQDDVGRRGLHTASFVMKLTPEMEAWMNLADSDEPMSQSEFAAFLEDRQRDVAEPDGATVLELARSLEVKNNVAFKGSQRSSDGGFNVISSEDVTTGSVEVPRRILLALAVFQGGPIIELPALLRFRLSAGTILFWIVFLDLERLLREEVDRVRRDIAAAIGAPLWAGSAVIRNR